MSVTVSTRKVYRYWQSCVGFSGNVDALIKMVDEAKEITWKTFRQHVSLADLEQLFPDYKWNQGPCRKDEWGLHIKDDYAVGFYRSKYKGRTVYFVDHGRIEYIFT